MTVPVHDNPDRHRFELALDGGVAFASYRRAGDVLTILHTEVPRALRGHGLGGKLIGGVLDLVRAEGLKVVPHCSFVRAYIDDHAEYADLLA